MRVLGIDLGARRIGLALSDPGGTVATPFALIERDTHDQAVHERIAQVVAAEQVELVVVGLPVSLSGKLGPAARAALAEASELARVVGVPVETYDERFTTVSAERSLGEAGVRARKRRGLVDKVAAAVMLQAWLDARSSPGASQASSRTR